MNRNRKAAAARTTNSPNDMLTPKLSRNERSGIGTTDRIGVSSATTEAVIEFWVMERASSPDETAAMTAVMMTLFLLGMPTHLYSYAM